MSKAARAIIVENGKMLVMYRNKYSSEYFTLVGGRVNEGETTDEALIREVREETGLTVTAARLVFVEEQPAPYNSQYIYLCEVAPHGDVQLGANSEEGMMNRLGMNIHEPRWVNASALSSMPFRSPNLHKAIIEALQKGFPEQPVKLS